MGNNVLESCDAREGKRRGRSDGIGDPESSAHAARSSAGSRAAHLNQHGNTTAGAQ
ncbi:MAG: hypothetical protein ACYDDU_09160 [Dermatophilaceae bacterium]